MTTQVDRYRRNEDDDSAAYGYRGTGPDSDEEPRTAAELTRRLVEEARSQAVRLSL